MKANEKSRIKFLNKKVKGEYKKKVWFGLEKDSSASNRERKLVKDEIRWLNVKKTQLTDYWKRESVITTVPFFFAIYA